MDERLGFPPAAIRWNIEGEIYQSPAKAFHAIVVAKGFNVLIEHGCQGKRERLRPNSITGRSILWYEQDKYRSHLLRWRDADAIALVMQNSEDEVEVAVASNDFELARKVIAEVEKLMPREKVTDDIVLPITFWHQGSDGPETTLRQIEVASWADIASNYVGETKTRLSALMDGFRPKKSDGRLLLWHGEPGTGKTFAIRALAWAWKEWCRFEYVIDPEQLFGRGSYLTEVALDRFKGHCLFEDKPSKDQWRLLIIEDSGEMIAMDAKNEVGQGLSRLLNLSDGILGQGTRIMILVTTNEELGKLNPAITRPGRCLSEIEFRRFGCGEAAVWLHHGGCNAEPTAPRTLSELYAIRAGLRVGNGPRTIGFGVVHATPKRAADSIAACQGIIRE